MVDPAILIGGLLVFAAQITHVSMATMRIILLVKGKRLIVGSIGFVEALIYIFALGYVMNKLDEPISILFYALGFAAGNIVGSIIEEKVAMGFTMIQVITMSKPYDLCSYLRDLGYGVTVLEGEGRDGKRLILNITSKRKDLSRLTRIIDDWDIKAFVTILDSRMTKGGFVQTSKIK